MYITVFMDVIIQHQRNRKESGFIPMIPQISPQWLLFSGILLQIHVLYVKSYNISHIPSVCEVYYGFYRRYYLEPTKSQRKWLYSDDSFNISSGTAVLVNIATDSRVIRYKLQDEPYPIGLRCILRFLSTLLPRTNEIEKKKALFR